jgi:hypothetical protein
VEAISKNYALSQEEVEGLETNAAEAIPKLLAKVHVQATLGAIHNIGNLVPAMVEKSLAQQAARTRNSEAFYSTFPKLDRNNPAHSDAVNRIAKAYRAANPSVPKAQMIQDVGLLAMQQLKIPFAAAAPNGRAPAFVPAVGGGAAVPPATEVADPFSGMGMDFDD